MREPLGFDPAAAQQRLECQPQLGGLVELDRAGDQQRVFRLREAQRKAMVAQEP